MQINIHHPQNLPLGFDQKQWVKEKVGHLVHLADRLSDESSQIKVDLFYESSHPSEKAYECHLTLTVPHSVLRAEAKGASMEASVNEAIDKAKGQIEKYKYDLHRMGERHS